MKKIAKIVCVALIMTMAATVVPTINVNAANGKAKVTYTLKKGVLTIKGKGAMPKKMTFIKNKKVKKVIIKKGVTSISNNAFKGCKNLTKITIAKSVKSIGWHSFEGTKISNIVIPSSVKTIGNEAFYGCSKLNKITIPGNFKLNSKQGDEESRFIINNKLTSVNFNTKLTLDNVKYFPTDNLYVYKKDLKYTSINGVIYSKDKTAIVRVPQNRTSITLEETCKVFPVFSVIYGKYIDDDGSYSVCKNLSTITIPETVEVINDTQYKSNDYNIDDINVTTINIQSKKIKSDGLVTLINNFKKIQIKDIQSQLKEQIKFQDDMYITNDGVLLKYAGNGSEVTVPEYVTKIGKSAFAMSFYENGKNLTKVNLANNGMLNEIEDNAFYNCKNLKEINLPETLKYIGSNILYNTGVEKIVVPASVVHWKESSLANTGVKSVVIPNNMVKIPDGMFEDSYELAEINHMDMNGKMIEGFPNTTTQIGDNAFCNCVKLDITKITSNPNINKVGKSAFAAVPWETITIPATMTGIGEEAFSLNNDKSKTVIIEGKTDNIDENAFSSFNVTFIFKSSIDNYKTNVFIKSASYKKNKIAKVSFKWSKVNGVDGYQIKVCSNSRFKNNVKTVYAKAGTTNASVTVKYTKKTFYVKLRPYKTINGKKSYGQWTMDVMK